MPKRIAILGFGLVAGLFTKSALAQSNINGQDINTITTGVPFLRISPDARSGAMGDVGIAISPDANTQYWNIGKMPFNKKKAGVAASVTPWLRDIVSDIYLAYISGYYKIGEEDNQSISASLRYFQLGDINYTDINANPIGSGRPREFAFDLGYGRKLSPYLSTGLALRYIHSNIATGAGATGGYKPGNAVATDLGLYYAKTKEIDEFRGNTFSAGVVLSNLGSKISYSATRRDFIPANLGIGAAYDYSVDEYNSITVALDINKLLVPSPQRAVDDSGNVYTYLPEKGVVSGMFSSFGDAPGGFGEEMREIQFSLGAEYWYQKQFAIRAGYFYEDRTKGNRKYFTVGVGFKYSVLTINAAYLIPSGAKGSVARNPLANTLRVTLVADFDDLKKSESAR